MADVNASTELTVLDDKRLAAAMTPVKNDDGKMVTKAFDELLAEVIEKAKAYTVDVSSANTRKEAKSHIHKIRRSKGAFEDAGKKAKADADEIVAEVNRRRNAVKDALDGVILELKKPIDEWEEKEEKRKAALEERVNSLGVLVTAQSSVADITADRDRIEAAFNEGDWDDFEERAKDAFDQAATRLTELLGIAKEREELEALRAAEEERRQKEAAEREAKEKADREAAEAKAAEEKAAADAAAKEAEERAAAAEKELEELKAQMAAAEAKKAEEAARPDDKELEVGRTGKLERKDVGPGETLTDDDESGARTYFKNLSEAEKRLDELRDCTELAKSRGNADANDYMRGMANGLILALATMEGKDPEYLDWPEDSASVA